MPSIFQKFKSGFSSAVSPPSSPTKLTTNPSSAAPKGLKTKDSTPKLSLAWVDVGLDNFKLDDASIITASSAQNVSAKPVSGSDKDGLVTGLEGFGKVRLSPEEVQVVWEKGGQRIINGGLNSLGLFRPYRLSESPQKIRRLISFYLLSLSTSSNQTLPTKSQLKIWAGLGEDEFAQIGEGWEKEVTTAGVSDVVVLLKWALRHLDYGKDSAFGSLMPLDWYTTFSNLEKESSFDPHSFSKLLIPALPPAHSSLLSEILNLISSVASHSEINGMPPYRLSFILGGWLFGIKSGEYEQWKKAGEALEHVWLAKVREEKEEVTEKEKKWGWGRGKREGIPMRLEELIRGYPYGLNEYTIPTRHAHDRHVHEKLLKVHVQAQGDWKYAAQPSTGPLEANDQATGLPLPLTSSESSIAGPFRRRNAGDILFDALRSGELEGDGEGEKAWNELVKAARVEGIEEEGLGEGTFDYERILSDEATRIIDSVSPAATMVEGEKAGGKLVRVLSTKAALERYKSVREKREREKEEKERGRSSEDIEKEKREFAAKRFKRRSFSLDLGKVATGGKGLGTLYEGGEMKSEVFTEGDGQGWDAFANAGFAPLSIEKEDNGLTLTPPGSPSLGPKKGHLKKFKTAPIPTIATREDGVRILRPTGEDSIFEAPKEKTTPSIPKVEKAEIGEFEECFADVWLESLGDPLVASSWPSMVVGELKTSLISKLGNRFNWLVVDMQLIPFKVEVKEEEPSLVSSQQTAAEEKKAKGEGREKKRSFGFRRKSTTGASSEKEKEKEREKRRSAIFSTPSFLRSKSSHKPEASEASASSVGHVSAVVPTKKEKVNGAIGVNGVNGVEKVKDEVVEPTTTPTVAANVSETVVEETTEEKKTGEEVNSVGDS